MILCKAAFKFYGGAPLNKSIQTNIMKMLFLLMVIPRKVNFTQMGRYGKRGEQSTDSREECMMMKAVQTTLENGNEDMSLYDWYDKRKLDFAFSSSFTAVNVAKIMCKEYNLKGLTVNAYYAQRIIDVLENNPNTQLNHEIVNEIFGFAADAV